MRRILLFVLGFVFVSPFVLGQAPKWYTESAERQIGVWIADNSKYESDQEPFQQYGIEWTYGGTNQSVHGVLFGIVDGKRTDPFWQFFQYWDPDKKQVVVIQVGMDGSVGNGVLKMTSDTVSEMIQTFTSPEGVSRLEGHKTTHYEGYDIGSSYTISEAGEWTKRRTYKWVKKDA